MYPFGIRECMKKGYCSNIAVENAQYRQWVSPTRRDKNDQNIGTWPEKKSFLHTILDS